MASVSHDLPLVIPLRDASTCNRSEVGGKAWALGHLMAGGFPVPDGFVVRGEAFRLVLDKRGAIHELRSADKVLIQDGGYEGSQSYRERMERILSTVVLPEALVRSIMAEYRRIGSPQVAVRSSAAFEDSEDSSFAGQHRSFIGVIGEDALVQAILDCWRSIWTLEAIEYRRRRGMREADLLMAVVVQRMVSARASGVVFTVDPVRGDSHTILVNVIEGLGEPLVSGLKTPWELRLPKERRWRSLLRRLARPWSTEQSSLRGAILSQRDLTELRKAAIKIEEWFGSPQDIEFAFEGPQFLILQSRPVTSLTIIGAVPKGRWTRYGFGEWFQRPASPLFGTLMLPEFSEATDDLVFRRWRLRRPWPTWQIIGGYYYTRATVKMSARLLLLPVVILRDAERALIAWQKEFVPEYERRVLALSQTPMPADGDGIAARLKEVVALAAQCWSWIIVTGIYAKGSEFVAKALARRAGLGSEDTLLLFAGHGNKSIETDEALWTLADSVRTNDSLRRVFEDSTPKDILEVMLHSPVLADWRVRFQEWLFTYGHRVFDLDIEGPTLHDRPEIGIEMVQSYLAKPQDSPRTRSGAAAARGREAQARLTDLLRGKSRLMASLTNQALRIAAAYAVVREDRPFYLHMTWPLMRRAVIALGELLVASQRLADASDVFFLTKDEVIAALAAMSGPSDREGENYGEQVRMRRAQYKRQDAKTPPLSFRPGLLLKWLTGTHPSGGNTAQEDGTVLVGVPGSPGRARGKLRVIRSENEFKRLQPGEILVAPSTTPAWTPLLGLAAGVVTEVGGALAHAAIIAREYGIPAVLGVEGLLDKVRDGELIEIDGSAGSVILETANHGGGPGVDATID